MTGQVFDVIKKEKLLKEHLENLGTRNVILHLSEDFVIQAPGMESGVNKGRVIKAQIIEIEFSAIYLSLRNNEGRLGLVTKIPVRKVERLEKDHATYPLFRYGSGGRGS